MSHIRVTQLRSVIGCPQDQRQTVRRLGLRRIGHSVVHADSPSVRGMAFKVRHLVTVTEIAPDQTAVASAGTAGEDEAL